MAVSNETKLKKEGFGFGEGAAEHPLGGLLRATPVV